MTAGLLRLMTTLAVAGAATATQAADPANGQKLARQCSVCHGKNGIARDPEVPNLAGQSAFYLQKILKDFRSGVREDRRMSLVTKPLSDEDIADLAAWYSTFVVTVEVPDPAAKP